MIKTSMAAPRKSHPHLARWATWALQPLQVERRGESQPEEEFESIFGLTEEEDKKEREVFWEEIRTQNILKRQSFEERRLKRKRGEHDEQMEALEGDAAVDVD